jgi:hypothetical protein
MGFSLGNLAKVGLQTAAGFATGGPAGAFVGFTQATKAEQQERKIKKQNQLIAQENARMSEIFGTSQGLTSVQAPMAGRTTQQAGFGAGFGTFLTDVGRNIVSPFAGLATQLAPFFGKSVQQQPAVTTTRSLGGQETQGSGSIQAGVGALVPGIVSGAGRFLKSPVGAIGTGLLGLGAAELFDGQPRGMRVTRKMKSQARTVLNMVGGDISAAAQILQIDEQTLVMILLKRFRNDGPVVTKAALRKTKQTVRRLKSMCDMYDDLRPRAAARRRTPMRRATSTTLIKN